MNIGAVYVDVIPNMAAMTAEVDGAVAAAGAEATSATATGVSAGAVTAARGAGVATAPGWHSMAKLAGGFLAYEFVKGSIAAAEEVERQGVYRLGSALAKAHLTSALPELKDWTEKFSLATGIAQIDLLKLEVQLAAAGAHTSTTIEQLASAAEGMAILSNKTVNLWTRQVIPAIFNAPQTAVTTLQRWHVLTQLQSDQIKQLAASGQSALATQEELNLFIQRGAGVAEKSSTPLMRFHAAFQNLEITMGTILLPIMQGVAGVLSVIFTWLERNKVILQAVVIAVSALAVAIIATKIYEFASGIGKVGAAFKNLIFFIGLATDATWLQVAATTVLDGLLMALPWVAVAAAVVVATVAIIKNWDAVKNFFVSLWDWITVHWKMVLEVIVGVLTGGLGAAIVFLATHFSLVKRIALDAWNALKTAGVDVWHALVTAAQPVIVVVKFVIHFVEMLVNALKKAFDFVMRIAHDIGHFFGGAIHVVGDVGHFFTHPFGLAEGGIATRPMMPLIAERGPEAVIPLDKLDSFGGGRVAEVTFTNWEEGKGFIRYLARDERAQSDTFGSELNRMGRRP